MEVPENVPIWSDEELWEIMRSLTRGQSLVAKLATMLGFRVEDNRLYLGELCVLNGTLDVDRGFDANAA